MKRSFDTLIELTQRKSDHAAQRLGALMAQARDSEYRGETLKAYRDDYRARLEEAIRRGVDATQLRNFQGFLGKLDEAVKQQQAEREHWAVTVDAARQNWQQEQQQNLSYSTIEKRRRQLEALHQARTEQKSTDEIAARRFSAGAASLSFGQ